MLNDCWALVEVDGWPVEARVTEVNAPDRNDYDNEDDWAEDTEIKYELYWPSNTRALTLELIITNDEHDEIIKTLKKELETNGSKE